MADNVKISDLTELTSGSLRDVTIFPVVDGGSTQKATLLSLQQYLADTLATDSELSTQVSNLTSTINGLDTDDINEGSTNQYYTTARVNQVIQGLTIISGSGQIEDLGFISSGTNIGPLNTFTASYYEDSASFETRILAISASSGDTTPQGTVSGSQQITDLGFIQSSTIDSLFIADRLPINILSSSEQLGQLIAINGGTNVTVTSGSGDQLSIEISSTGGGGGGVEYDSEYEIVSQSNITGESNANLDGMLLRSGDETTFSNFSASVAAGGGGGGGSTDYISNVSTTIAHTIAFTGIGSAFNGSINLPDGIVSSSTQIEDLGFSAGGENIIVSGLQAYTASLKSVAIISGSQQITDFGFVSESSTTIPQGTISGSQQITDLGFLSSSSDLTGITSSAGVVLADADNTGFDTSYVNENPAYLYYTDARVETHLGVIGLLTGSQGLASGSVTSSAQINYGEIRNIPKFWGDGVTISSGSSGDTVNYIQITSTGAGGTLSSEFYSFTASYELEKVNFITGSSQIEALGFDPNAGEVVTLNAWTGSGGAFGVFSQSVVNQIENLNTGSAIDDLNTLLEKDLFSSSLQVNYAQIPDTPSFVAGPNITINISGSSFGQTFEISGSEVSGDFTTLANVPEGLISQSAQIGELGYATTGYADGVGTTTSQSLESAFNTFRSDIGAIQADYANLGGNTFTGSQLIKALVTADEVYVTGSLSITAGTGQIKGNGGLPSDIVQMTGSFKVTGSVEADEFIIGSTGTPTISSATNIEVSASADINMIAQEVNITDVLTITPRTTTPSSPSSGSFIVSGSGATIKPFFYDGNQWQEISFV